jgi:putative (di)nucleoside polyphosphate hydrolase
MENKQLPLRTGVGIVVLNKENRVFVAKRKDNPVDNWQMPQGGVDEGEDLLSAMKRELLEETSIYNIKILKKLDYWLEYMLPKNLIGIIWKGKYSGQKQKWFIVKFLGNDSEININTKNPEFIEWKWIEIKHFVKFLVYRRAYIFLCH